MIRRANDADISAIATIYDAIHAREASGEMTVGWQSGVYPTADTAQEAIRAGEMFVLEDGEKVVASARINRVQMPAYAQVAWRYAVPDERVLVMHTLTVDPTAARRGYARQMLAFYEDEAGRQAVRRCASIPTKKTPLPEPCTRDTAISRAASYPVCSTAFRG